MGDDIQDIVVCIPKGSLADIEQEEREVAERCAKGEQGIEYWWKMGKLPVRNPERIYFCWEVDGVDAIRAWHKITRIEREEKRIYMAPDINPITPALPMFRFRGFRYMMPPATIAAMQAAKAEEEAANGADPHD